MMGWGEWPGGNKLGKNDLYVYFVKSFLGNIGGLTQ